MEEKMSKVERFNRLTPVNPYKFYTKCRETYGVRKRHCYELPGVEGRWMIRYELLDHIIEVRCPKTHNIFPYLCDSKTDKTELRCLGCKTLLFKKKKVGRKTLYSKLQQEVLDKSHHKWVQDRLKTQIFESNAYECRRLYSLYHEARKKAKYGTLERNDLDSLCKCIWRYIKGIEDIDALEIEENHELLDNGIYKNKADRKEQLRKLQEERKMELGGDYEYKTYDEYGGDSE